MWKTTMFGDIALEFLLPAPWSVALLIFPSQLWTSPPVLSTPHGSLPLLPVTHLCHTQSYVSQPSPVLEQRKKNLIRPYTDSTPFPTHKFRPVLRIPTVSMDLGQVDRGWEFWLCYSPLYIVLDEWLHFSEPSFFICWVEVRMMPSTGIPETKCICSFQQGLVQGKHPANVSFHN